jgi:hypothetical protein
MAPPSSSPVSSTGEGDPEGVEGARELRSKSVLQHLFIHKP